MKVKTNGENLNVWNKKRQEMILCFIHQEFNKFPCCIELGEYIELEKLMEREGI